MFLGILPVNRFIFHEDTSSSDTLVKDITDSLPVAAIGLPSPCCGRSSFSSPPSPLLLPPSPASDLLYPCEHPFLPSRRWHPELVWKPYQQLRDSVKLYVVKQSNKSCEPLSPPQQVRTAPIVVYTSRKGSSAAGLTASVICDNNTVTFLSFYFFLYKYSTTPFHIRAAIHEAMEQKTISITKAGITTILNSRTSVLAATNPPSGCYDDLKTAQDNIDLHTTILSRFDLIFIVEDINMFSQDKMVEDLYKFFLLLELKLLLKTRNMEIIPYAGVDVNIRNLQKTIPLHVAVARGSKSCVGMLLSAGGLVEKGLPFPLLSISSVVSCLASPSPNPLPL
ncbi:unnamed protein product [Lactuca saligna]|uniref:MCM C-terminal AAA(+) ATPase domain-containing protein n=1 Tax=Lactuca saligna TaxID=75948 RepID=A0AA35V1Y5_LACSI|nr:unnamed protein product [Lactuca saligna]